MDQGNRLLRFGRKRKLLTPMREACNLSELVGELPGEGESLRLISFCSFSAVGFLRWVADQHVIRWMGVTTFRVGPRCIKLLRRLHDSGRLLDADFVLGRLAGSRHGESARSLIGWTPCAGRRGGAAGRPATTPRRSFSTRTPGAGCWRHPAISTTPPTGSSTRWSRTMRYMTFTGICFSLLLMRSRSSSRRTLSRRRDGYGRATAAYRACKG